MLLNLMYSKLNNIVESKQVFLHSEMHSRVKNKSAMQQDVKNVTKKTKNNIKLLKKIKIISILK